MSEPTVNSSTPKAVKLDHSKVQKKQTVTR